MLRQLSNGFDGACCVKWTGEYPTPAYTIVLFAHPNPNILWIYGLSRWISVDTFYAVKKVLAILVAIVISLTQVAEMRQGACFALNTATVKDCCEADRETGAHSERDRSAEDRCADCSVCELPAGPSMDIRGLSFRIAISTSIFDQSAEETLVSDALILPLTPPPRV